MALFALVSAFFCCNIWFLGEVLLDGADIKAKNYEILSRLMRMLNSCTNIFIYCFVDRTFKRYFKEYLKRIPYLMTCTLVEVAKPEEVTQTTNYSETQSMTKQRKASTESQPMKRQVSTESQTHPMARQVSTESQPMTRQVSTESQTQPMTKTRKVSIKRINDTTKYMKHASVE